MSEREGGRSPGSDTRSPLDATGVKAARLTRFSDSPGVLGARRLLSRRGPDRGATGILLDAKPAFH
jgi:hypothetical protein